jgi:hypothetical protein
MKIRKIKILVAMLFLSIFSIKMVISLAPAFLYLDNKTVTAVILQLELESKADKDSLEKDAVKEKKVFDETYMHFLAYHSFLNGVKVLYNSEHCLYKQVHHPQVPTPPPNV